ncbi:MAG: cytochrome c [Rhodoferax sp.]
MKHLVITCSALVLALSASAGELNGQALYQQNCAACHGETGKGGKKDVKGPRLAGDSSKWKVSLFQRAVLEGIDDHGKPLESAMPHWKGASFKSDAGAAPTKEEVAAIQKYLRTVK